MLHQKQKRRVLLKTKPDMMSLAVVVDYFSSCILLNAPSPSVAYSVSLGISDTTSMNIILETPLTTNPNETYCTLKKNFDGSLFTIIPLATERINDDLTAKIKLALIRGKAIHRLEIGLQRYLDRADDFYDTQLDPYFVYCLSHSDPKKNEYAEGVHEYAAISEISPYAAYHEMQLRVESFGMFKLRNYAHYKLYVNTINKLHTQNEIDAQFVKWRDTHYYWSF